MPSPSNQNDEADDDVEKSPYFVSPPSVVEPPSEPPQIMTLRKKIQSSTAELETTSRRSPSKSLKSGRGKRKTDAKTKITDHFKEVKPKKRTVNRFNGMSEEEIAKKGLPDYLKEDLDVVFIGINPSMFAAYTGKYYDGPGNHFWQALYLSGFLPEVMGPKDDYKLMDLGIGFTNVVARTTRGIADLTRQEIAEGAIILREKLSRYKPKIAVFNGKAIYQVYSGEKKFMFGRQPSKLEGTDTWVWVMPSSSARCAQLPRAIDKVPFFSALKRFLDYLKGVVDTIDEEEIVFANVVLKNAPRKIKSEPVEVADEVGS